MKLFCCYTPAHEPLFREYFTPCVEPTEFDLTAYFLEIAGKGNFLADDFLRCIREKLSLMVKSIEDNPDSIILWSDVDIVFSGAIREIIERTFQADPQLKLLFQREAHRLPDVNTGFIAIRCDAESLEFFRRISQQLLREPAKNEQAVVNDFLRDGATIRWSYLPWNFYARTHGWPPPRETILYHANYTKGPDGVRQKMEQLTEYRRIRHSDLRRLWSCLRRVPGKLRAKLSNQEAP